MISPYCWYGWFIPLLKSLVNFSTCHFGAELRWFPSVLCCGASPKRRGRGRGRGLRGRGPCGCSEICRKLDFERMTLVAAGRGPQNRRWWKGVVVWNHGILWLSIYWECHHPNWLSYFSEGLKPPTRICWKEFLKHSWHEYMTIDLREET